MAPKVKVETGVIPYFERAAAELGIEISAYPVESILRDEEHLAVVAISSARSQIATYPAVRISHYRNRTCITHLESGHEFLSNLQRLVNERVRRDHVEGVATFIFSTDGELLTIQDQIGVESLWSLEYSSTSIFDNAIRAANDLPLGRTDLIDREWLVMNFDAPKCLDMTQPFLHLFAHEPGYRINKSTSHSGYVALRGNDELFERVKHAVDYLEGVINE